MDQSLHPSNPVCGYPLPLPRNSTFNVSDSGPRTSPSLDASPTFSQSLTPLCPPKPRTPRHLRLHYLQVLLWTPRVHFAIFGSERRACFSPAASSAPARLCLSPTSSSWARMCVRACLAPPSLLGTWSCTCCKKPLAVKLVRTPLVSSPRGWGHLHTALIPWLFQLAAHAYSVSTASHRMIFDDFQ